MPNILTNLRIDEVSFCRKGLNPHARIALFKSADRDDDIPTRVDLAKGAGDATAVFEGKVNEIQKRDGCSRSVAMSKAADEFPAELEAYRRGPSSRPVHKAEGPKPAAVAFEGRIVEIQKRDNCSRLDAMSRAAQEFPSELEAYRATAG